ncbi:MlaD family protein [Burkholderiaceae bacterium FT117]|uniref:MlaD family protein n=1 Tax=Zeimonas sediminis TaxID=2944268 RepID=UPI002342DA5F|nr:MlaD family protein [Zeimonas sediminis]MCM5571839.1 MlaD family protein [Zeimonas sediminis]
MEPEARYTLVGAAVLAIAAMLVAALVWLSGEGGSDYRFYTIHFEKQSLDGLQLGSDVNMRGVKVGRVQSYALSPQNINRVDVTIRVSRDTPVSQNTTAVVTRNLVTGLARIDLVTPGTPGPELVQVLPGEEHPVIPEGTSGLSRIADALGELAATGESALGNLDKLLSAENRETVMQTVVAARDLIAGLDKRLARLDGVADGVQQATAAFRDTAVAFRDTARALEQSGREVSAAVASASAQIDPLTAQTKSVLADLSAAARALERESAAVVQRLETATDAGAMELRVTARELRGSAESLARAAERLGDPAAAILGPSQQQLGPGEGKR